MIRSDGRDPKTLRDISITDGHSAHAAGNVLYSQGKTVVQCTASVEEGVPPWREGRGLGWVTGEYSMLPGSTHTRRKRERGGKVDSRSTEISRLLGRSLRSVVDFKLLGERTIVVDCDVLCADGGTRCASIAGGFTALSMALQKLQAEGKLDASPLKDEVAAVSLGLIDGTVLLDLPYEEDSRADVDLNLVMTGRGELVEVQATAEGEPFGVSRLTEMLELGGDGIQRILARVQGFLQGKQA